MSIMRSIQLAFAAALATASPALADDAVIVLTPNLASAEREALGRLTLEFAVESLAPGEEANVLNGATQELIGAYVAPDKSGLRAAVRANPEFMQGLKTYMEGETGDVSGGFDLPKSLRHIGDRYLADGESVLVVIGSPLHHEPKDVAFSMTETPSVPNDAHLLASREVTPYGAAEDAGRLAGYRAYFGAVGPDWRASEQHGFRVERYVSLSHTVRGARFITFSDDAATAFRDAAKDGLPGREYELQPEERLLMLQFQPQAALSEAVDGGWIDTPLFERDVETGPADPAIIAAASNVELGIRWACQSCDIDLAVRPTETAAILFYDNPSSALGRLYKDFTNSPSEQNGWETVALTGGSVDLRAVRIALNFYSGHAPGGAAGEIRISIDGRTWAAPFRISASSGNRGAGREATFAAGRAASDAWLVIDPVSVLGG